MCSYNVSIRKKQKKKKKKKKNKQTKKDRNCCYTISTTKPLSGSLGPKPISRQCWPESDCTNAQTNPGFRCPHIREDTFLHCVANFIA